MSYPLTDDIGSDITRALGQMDITGNVVPLSWFAHLKHPGGKKQDGKPNLAAILILSDIVYWYRPKEIRNEETGAFIGWEKKYKGDLLQRTYQSYADMLGLTKRIVQRAFDCLEQAGLIWLEFRTVRTETSTLGNVMFIGVNSNRLAQITYPITFKGNRYDLQRQEGIPSKATPEAFKGKTLTKNTTETPNTDHTETTTTGAPRDNSEIGQCGPTGEQVVVVSKETVEHLTQVLVDYGCPRRKAQADVKVALEAGFYPSWLEYNILRWFAYTRSPQGKGIKTPATFVLSKVKCGDPCPDDFEVTAAYAEYRRVCELEAAWIAEHKADQPDSDSQPTATPDEGSTLAASSDDDQDTPPAWRDSMALPIPGCAMTTDQAWAKVLETLRWQLTWAVWSTWLAPTWVIDISGDSFFVGVHSQDALEWLECHKELHTLIERTLTNVIGVSHRFKVRFQTLE